MIGVNRDPTSRRRILGIHRFGRVEVIDLLDMTDRAFADWKEVRQSVHADVLVGCPPFDKIRS
ncbi:MAG: hypothetical protein F4Y01_08480 [Gammaproteobacteria bacterium]|nr:hypothetical protein [Gammaproteobacteria bacterium]